MSKNTRNRVMAFIYISLFTFLGGSLFVFIHSFLTLSAGEWNLYVRAYFILLVIYTWYTFILLFLYDLKKVKYPAYTDEPIAVVVPCYNEKPKLLEASLTSVLKAKGNKEIFVINDGSKKEISESIRDVIQKLNNSGAKIYLHVFEKNKGKRHAIHYAVTNLIKNSPFIVTMDSDTILDGNALVRIVEPLKASDIGAVTGDVRLLNENQSWFTKMIGTYYWVAMNVGKKAQSSRGIVACCSGCLSAYKMFLLKKVVNEFVDQEFLGLKCTHSEDRHLTNLILENGYRVVYVPETISYTETPSTFTGFMKQQLRWQRGYIQESIYALTFTWRTQKLLFIQLLFWDLTSPFLTFGIQIATFFIIFAYPKFFLLFVLPGWLIFILLRNIFIIFQARDKFNGLFSYTFFHMIFMYWLTIYALFTVRNKSWITR